MAGIRRDHSSDLAACALGVEAYFRAAKSIS
jgi:hypothetical protein